LDPTGVQWQVTPLASGVYALVANRPPFDNNGIVIGRDGVLVVDSSVSPESGAERFKDTFG
jgi:cyclase